MSLDAAFAAYRAGQPHEAVRLLTALGPAVADDPVALQLWSVCLPKARRAAARALTERAIRIAPSDANAHFNLGVMLQDLGDLDRAVLRYQDALRLDPVHTGALNNLSDLYRRRDRAEEGWALMQRYLAAGAPENGLEIRLAKLAMDTRRFDEAERWFQAAARHDPKSVPVVWEHAMLSLAREDWKLGWAQYEARIPLYGLPRLAAYPHAAPFWRGEPIKGKRLLIHREQGLGDMIMFAQAVPGLIAAGAEVHLAQSPALARLFAESFPEAKVWSSVTAVDAQVQPPQPYLKAMGKMDFQALTCSLGALCMSKGSPRRGRYLKAPSEEVARWRARLDALAPLPPGHRRMGLVIGARRPRFSDDGMTNGIRKSVPPAEAGRLASARNVQWVALHDRESAPMLADIPGLTFIDPSPWITDLCDTAAIIETLGGVVSVDTAVAHLTGALGKPLHLMLWRNPDWRWGVDRRDSVFYDGVTVHRQSVAHQWGPVLESVVAALNAET